MGVESRTFCTKVQERETAMTCLGVCEEADPVKA